MEDIINAIATDASASEVSDALKNALFAKTGEKIDAMKSGVANKMFAMEPEEVEEIEIDGNDYFTNDSQNGTRDSVDDDGDPGDEVGWFENGTAFFS